MLTLMTMMILVLLAWRSVFAVLGRRSVPRGIAAPLRHYNNSLRRRFSIFGQAQGRVIAENVLGTDSERICLPDKKRRPKMYLQLIVALTGGAQADDGYFLDVGNTRFHVRDRHVRRWRDPANPESGYDETCFYCAHKSMPREEEIASALLLLKHNPMLFDKWAMQNGLAVRADGDTFTLRE